MLVVNGGHCLQVLLHNDADDIVFIAPCASAMRTIICC